MLLGALLDAGASLAAVQHAVDAVVPGATSIGIEEVTRAGLRATKAVVDVRSADQPHRAWSEIRELLASAEIEDSVRQGATAVFAKLAAAEAVVHGIAEDSVHFHEVGALDSIADIVGVCAALDDLDITSVSAGAVAVGSGRVTIDHGEVGVPVPAVVELSQGWRVHSGGHGELATPTGMALVVALAEACHDLPELLVRATGTGAGSHDRPGRANVTRVIIGDRAAAVDDHDGLEPAVLLEANIDDLDPRLWPGVVDRLLSAGASDAWLVPILMKKGRPAQLLSALCPTDRVSQLRELILMQTSTFGVRQHLVHKYALPRSWVEVDLEGVPVSVKVAHRGGKIIQVTPEFESVAAAALRLGRTQAAVLAAAARAAADTGLLHGEPLP